MLGSVKSLTTEFSKSRLEGRNKPLAALLELSNFLSGTLELQPLLEGALAIVLKHFDLDAGRIYLWDPKEQYLVLKAHEGLEIMGLERVHLGEGFSGKSAATKSFIAQHVSELVNKERADLLCRKGFKIIICVPFIVMDQVEGVMNLAAKDVIKLEQEEIDLLMVMGHQIGVASSHAGTYRDLQQKLNEVKEKKETIKLFAYTVSHDLKSPAIGLYGLVRRLRRDYEEVFDEKGRLYCDQILKTAEHIVSMTEQINTYITTREVPLRLEQVNMKELLSKLKQEFSSPFQERNIALLEPKYLPEIMVDELHLTRAFRNFLDNALKYGGKGLSEIRIGYQQKKRYHLFSVTDNGVGIDRSGAEKLFQFFQRLETSNHIEGSGMGLAIAKEVAKKHLGDVWVESEPGQGATFYLSIARRLESLYAAAKRQQTNISS
jgi:signal transduction histidine kinase